MTTKAVSATVSSFPTKPPWLVEGEKMSARREKGQGEFPPMLLGPTSQPHTCMPLCITGQGSWNEPSACCWVSSHLIDSCSFSGEPPTCSWAKLSIFNTKAVSLEHGKGQMGIETGPEGTQPHFPRHLVSHPAIILGSAPSSPGTSQRPSLTRCCCLDVTMPHRNHLFSETAGSACSLGEERRLLR